MKHYGCILDFTDERNAELMRAYRERLADADYILMPDIFARVADSPCSRFWVSEERACIVVSAMMAGRPPKGMRACKREMFREVYRRFRTLRKAHPEKTVFELCVSVVHQPAPKFYMTPRTVGELIYRIKNGWYDRHRRT